MRGARDFFRDVYRDQRRRVWLVLGLMGAASLTDAVGLVLLVPLLGLVGLDVGQGSVGQLEATVSVVLGRVGIPMTLAGVLIVYVGLVAVRQFAGVWEATAVARLEQHFVRRLRNRLYGAIVKVPWVHFSRGRRSDFIHLLTTELDRVSAAASEVPRLVSLVLLGIAYAAIAAYVSLPLTAIAAGAGTLLMILLRGWNSRAERRGVYSSELSAELQAEATENLRGLKTVRSYGAGGPSVTRFSKLGTRVARNWIGTMRDYAVASALFSIGTAAALAVIVWFAMTRMALPTATVLLCIYLFARIVPRFNALLSSYRYLKNALPAYSNVRAMIAWTDANRAEPLIGATDVSLTRQVEIRDVTFQYPTARERVAVEDVSMRIGAGETVALVGRSGAGKSTLADLLLGLLEPSEGQVVIDGEPLAMENATAWRTRIGYVPQRTFLLHDTVCANLAWGAPGSTEGQMWEALRLAGAEDFVRRLPGELDAVIGDEGALLSGGEQQRLALARALLREPELLILDEATSALDFENERSILDALGELDGRIATLLITHRLQVAREADRIYVLEQGRIVEAGSWNDLMGRRGGTLLELLQAQAVKGAPEKPVETGAHEAVGVA